MSNKTDWYGNDDWADSSDKAKNSTVDWVPTDWWGNPIEPGPNEIPATDVSGWRDNDQAVKAVNQIEETRKQLKKEYEAAAQESYIQNMLSQLRTPQQLAAAGLNGGGCRLRKQAKAEFLRQKPSKNAGILCQQRQAV